MNKETFHIAPECNEHLVPIHSMTNNKVVNLHTLGKSTLANFFSIKRINMRQHTLIFTLAGSGSAWVNQQRYQLTENTAMVIPAGSSYELNLASDSWYNVWCLLPNNDYWRYLNARTTSLYDCAENKLIEQTVNLLSEENQQRVGRTPEAESLLVDLLFSYLARATQQEISASKNNIKLQMLFDEVSNNLSYKWTVAKLAEKVHLSEPHFYRLCKQEFNASPQRHLSNLRMKQAKYLLEHSNYTVTYIAQMLGYADTFSFSHRFRKAFTLSPSEFRKRCN